MSNVQLNSSYCLGPAAGINSEDTVAKPMLRPTMEAGIMNQNMVQADPTSMMGSLVCIVQKLVGLVENLIGRIIPGAGATSPVNTAAMSTAAAAPTVAGQPAIQLPATTPSQSEEKPWYETVIEYGKTAWDFLKGGGLGDWGTKIVDGVKSFGASMLGKVGSWISGLL